MSIILGQGHEYLGRIEAQTARGLRAYFPFVLWDSNPMHFNPPVGGAIPRMYFLMGRGG